MAIEYSELNDGLNVFPREHYGWENGDHIRRLVCNWSDRYELADEIDGTIYPYNTNSGAYCIDIRIDPWPGASEDAGSGMAYYEKAVVTALYSTRYYHNGTELRSEELGPKTTTLSLSHYPLAWGAANGPPLHPKEAPEPFLPGLVYTITRHKIWTMPVSVLGLVGCINSGAVSSVMLGLTFGAQTLLYQPPRITRKFTSGGITSFFVKQSFIYQPGTWNKCFRTDTATWTDIYVAGGDRVLPYTVADFSSIV